jgi:preprotein translocase subunit SecG
MESIFLNIRENISSPSYRKNQKKAKKREFAIKGILYIIRRILYISFHTMHILLVIISTLIIIAVAIQAKWSGLSIIPGSGDFGKFERRGPEKILHNATIVLTILFVVVALLSYFLA